MAEQRLRIVVRTREGCVLDEQVGSVPGDIISVQGVVRGGLLSPQIGMHHAYFGVQDTEPVVDLKTSRIQALAAWDRVKRQSV